MMTDDRLKEILKSTISFPPYYQSHSNKFVGEIIDEVLRLRHELTIVTLNRNSLRKEADTIRTSLSSAERERDELKRRLAVFTEGRPSSLALSLFVNDLENKVGTPEFRDLWSVHNKDGTEETIYGCIQWLRRISSLNEVPHD